MKKYLMLGLLGVIQAACSEAPGEEGPAEAVAKTRQALTFPPTARGSATPVSGTMLPVSAARAANVPPPTGTGFGTPIVNVEGLNNVSSFFPPDTIGDVGLRHYIQATNTTPGSFGGPGALFTIFDKAGNPVSPEVTAVPLAELVATEGPCSNAGGDPVVNYDRGADRWVLLQFAVRTAGNHLCVYVSETNEPEALNDWNLYDFDLGTLVDAAGNPAPGGFPDYLKLGIWSDAYYVTTNDVVSPGVQDVAVYALERGAMLAGTTAAVQRFELPLNAGPNLFQPATPVDWDSSLPPPSGAPGLVMRRVDDEVHAPPGNPASDQLEIWELDVDFANMNNSTLDGPNIVTTDEFDTNICSLFLFAECADQPTTTQRLSVVGSFVILWRVQYRNFGDRETLVGNFDVNDGAGNPAPHWFELNRTSGADFTLVQEQTYAPDDNDRWMGSIAMDGSGNIAIGYSTSSTTLFPSIRYTGREAADALDLMTEPEATIIDGTGAQLGSPGRWGDYSSMNVDPVDDCTFWFTSEYYETTSAVGWTTRIASFRFPNCGAEPVCLLGENRVDLRDRVVATAETAAGTFLEIGAPATLNGNGRSGGNALIRSNGVVDGDLTLGGTLQTQGPFTITGTLSENASPSIPALPTKTVTAGPGSQSIPPNAVVTLAPGTRGAFTIGANADVTLTTGVYNFASLGIQPDVDLIISGDVEINVQGNVAFGDRSDVLGSGDLALYTNGSVVTLGTDATFDGIIVAPNATVTVFSRTDVAGCIGGEIVRFEPDATLVSGGRSLPTGGSTGPTCSDGIQNGGETGVDCGGPCPACSTGTLAAVLSVQSNWGSGYCAELRVTNPNPNPTTNWSVGLNMNGSSIYTSWNGIFSGSTGNVTAAPAFSWNRVIAPGATNNSVGFCAYRPPGAAIATVTGVTGTF